jgi:hypothetical protein
VRVLRALGLAALAAAAAPVPAQPPAAVYLDAARPAAPGPARAVTLAVSPGPQAASVTVYRAPGRSASEPINLQWLNGYALVTETRRIVVPAGESELRFEGVAGGILPQSAILSGLPGYVVEKNQDAWLLSPASLLDASLGRRVHLTRTWRRTGQVREQEAVVRSGPEGAVVIETPDGIEALRCDGLPERLGYDRVPERLSAKPTLSVRVRSPRRAAATITLSYLASEFDWQANYIARLAPDEKSMDLFAWLTLANGGETGFAGADAQAVAGRLNRQDVRARKARAEPLVLRCWPSGTTTSDLKSFSYAPEQIVVRASRMAYANMMAPPAPLPPPPPPPPPPPMAQQEALGDLKLYRIPIRVTVAARSQKQVALLAQKAVRVEIVYRSYMWAWNPGTVQPIARLLRTKNLPEQGLGLPLPSGGVVLMREGARRPLFYGRGALDDKAVGEDIEIQVGGAGAVTASAKTIPLAGGTDVEYTVANARAVPIAFELAFPGDTPGLSSETPLGRKNGAPLWSVTVPANGSATLHYRMSKR